MLASLFIHKVTSLLHADTSWYSSLKPHTVVRSMELFIRPKHYLLLAKVSKHLIRLTSFVCIRVTTLPGCNKISTVTPSQHLAICPCTEHEILNFIYCLTDISQNIQMLMQFFGRPSMYPSHDQVWHTIGIDVLVLKTWMSGQHDMHIILKVPPPDSDPCTVVQHGLNIIVRVLLFFHNYCCSESKQHLTILCIFCFFFERSNFLAGIGKYSRVNSNEARYMHNNNTTTIFRFNILSCRIGIIDTLTAPGTPLWLLSPCQNLREYPFTHPIILSS